MTTLAAGVHWVGAVDWHLRDFHGFETRDGATYNAYLIEDQRSALIDGVKAPFAEELIAKVQAHGVTPSYLVCNHAEPDHSGALIRLCAAFPQAVVVCSAKCAEILGRYYDTSSWKVEIVRTGSTLSLGRRALTFIETPMVHWPDSIFTYLPEEQILFSMDAFGQHLATSERFDDQIPVENALSAAKTYYANIVMPWGKQVVRALEQAQKREVRMVAPSHGIVWRTHIQEILNAYQGWAMGRLAAKVLIAYDSMWGSTETLAKAVAEGVAAEGLPARLVHTRTTGYTALATELLDSAGVALGSSSFNVGPLPSVAGALAYMKGLRPGPRAALAFGSYGWDRSGPTAVHEWQQQMKWLSIREPIAVAYAPKEADLAGCREAGRLLAQQSRARAQIDANPDAAKIRLESAA